MTNLMLNSDAQGNFSGILLKAAGDTTAPVVSNAAQMRNILFGLVYSTPLLISSEPALVTLPLC
jgi:hypothetical protein